MERRKKNRKEKKTKLAFFIAKILASRVLLVFCELLDSVSRSAALLLMGGKKATKANNYWGPNESKSDTEWVECSYLTYLQIEGPI